MCGSMVDIQSLTAEIRREKKKKMMIERNYRMKILWSALLHRATITSGYATLFTAGGAIRIAYYDVIDDVITRKL